MIEAHVAATLGAVPLEILEDACGRLLDGSLQCGMVLIWHTGLPTGSEWSWLL